MFWWILLAVYVIGFIIFMISVITEAPKHGTKLQVVHVIVALLWPAWGIWYLCDLLYDKWNKR